MRLKKALLIVDLQNDFCPKGRLPVPEGDKVVRVLNKYIKIFSQRKLPIFASRDWHPKETKHFKKYGGVWPVHCIQNTKGAQFHPKLKLSKEVIIISKGMNPKEDSYSVFQGFDPNGQEFLNLLKILGINQLYVGGLATDYCVKFTVLDALKLGFKVRILVDAVKGVDLKKGDSEKAIKEMIGAGAKKMSLRDLKENDL